MTYLPPGRLENWSESSAPTSVAPLPVAACLAAATAAASVPLLGSTCSCTVNPRLPAGQSDVNDTGAVVPPAPAVAVGVGVAPSVTTCGAAAVCSLERPARPIRTPTSSASRRQPTPARRPRSSRHGESDGGGPGSGGAGGGGASASPASIAGRPARRAPQVRQ